MSTAVPTEARKRVKELSRLLHHYNQRYYQESISEVSDKEFDTLLAELQQLESDYPSLLDPNSPTQRVGGTINKKFQQFTHLEPMLSLENSYSEDDLKKFDERVRKGSGLAVAAEVGYIAELKYDGVAISLHYKNRALKRAITRGNGKQGDDITDNVRTIKNLPLQLADTAPADAFEVRGEIVLPKSRFEALNKQIKQQNVERELAGKKAVNLLANPRNAASGTLKMQDSKVVAQRNLSAYVYSLQNAQQLGIASHQQALEHLQQWGFPVSDTYRYCPSLEEVFAYLAHWKQKRFTLDAETDGVVVKVNSLQHQQELGATSKSPRWAMAYKFPAEAQRTKLLSVSYQVGRTGAVTPVANVAPVQLSGTTVRRATLHNANEIKRLDLRLNDWVFMEKGGEIIPKIIEVDIAARKEAEPSEAISFPTHCPECQTPLEQPEGEAATYCPNAAGCPPQRSARLQHFIQRKALDIDSLGAETLEQLMRLNLVSEPADLYSLEADQLAKLERTGEKTIQNILKGIEASKQIPFQRVLFGLGIRHVGETMAAKLARHFGSIEAIAAATADQLTAIHDVGQSVADSLKEYFSVSDNLEQLEMLKQAGLQLEVSAEAMQITDSPLNGKRVLVSGNVPGYTRLQLKELLEKNGASVASGVSAKLDYFFVGEEAGASKLKKAEELGIAKRPYTELIDYISGK